jgi:hypothetical protein
LEQYRFESALRFATIVKPQSSAVISQRLATFGEHPAGLGKFTRTMFAQDLRRSVLNA